MSGSTSIGELSIGVTLNASRLDADMKAVERKTKAQIKQLDAEYSKIGKGAMGFGSGFGTGYAGPGRRFGGGSGGGMSSGARGAMISNAAFQVQDVAVQVAGGQGLTRALGQQLPQLLQIFGPYGAIAGALVATAFVFKKELADAASNFGDVLNGSVGYMSGKAAERMEAQMGALAKAQGFNSWAEYKAAVGDQRASNKLATRNATFNATDEQGRVRILQDEIAKLRNDQKTARVAGRTLDVEKMNAEIASKSAEMSALQKSIEDRMREFDNNTRMQAAARMDAQEAEAREAAEASRKSLDDVLRSTELALAQAGLDRIRGQRGSLRNPFNAEGVVGFGTAGDGGAAAREGTRILAQQLATLKRQEELLEDLVAKL